MAGQRAKWLTVAPLVAMLTAWAARIIRGRTESAAEEAEAEAHSSNIRVTMDVYGHLYEDSKDELARRLETRRERGVGR